LAIRLLEREKKLLEDAKKFSMTHFAPDLDQWENGDRNPKDAIKKLADNGYCGLGLPEELGGRGLNFLERSLVYEGLAYGAGTLGFLIQLHNNISFEIGTFYNTSPEVKSLVPGMAKGEDLTAFALTEETAGSDPKSINSYAELQKDGYHIYGEKKWIANAEEASYFNVIVKDGSPDADEMLMLLVDRDDPNFHIGEDKPRLGSNAMSCCDLRFEDCVVPEERLLSDDGLKEALRAIDVARVFTPAISIGIAQRAIDLTVDYLGDRVSFGEPIINSQGVQWSLSELTAKIEAGRWLVYSTASQMDDNADNKSIKAAMNKLYGPDIAMEATTKCLQLFGAKGYEKNSILSNYMALAKLLQIIDGTTQIQKIVISRALEKQAKGL